MSSAITTDRALVIEGTVMFGFAASKCAEFAYQNLGIDVCQIIPVAYSNNIMYDHYIGKKLSIEDVNDIYEKLKANGLHRRFTIIKSGYLETAEVLRKVGEIVADIKKVNPAAIYVCDPVEGDNGADYATIRDAGFTNIYKELLLPLADIAAPNQFEFECLTSMKIHNQDEALEALQILHDMGPNVVMVTSCKLDTQSDKKQALIASRWKGGKREAYRIDFEYIDVYICGAGDMFLGCFVGYLRQSDDLKTSLEKAVSTIQYIIQSTYKHAMDTAGPGNKLSPEALELRAVQCAAFMREPKITHPATKLL